MAKRSLGWLVSTLAVWCWAVPAAHARTFTSETEFLQAVTVPTTESFDQFSVGFLPQTTLQMATSPSR